MSKILRNDHPVNPVVLTDVGVVVAPSSSYVIPPQDYPAFAASSDVIIALCNNVLILNDGGNDITVLSDAVDIIKGWFPSAAPVGDDFFFDYYDVPVGAGPHILFTQPMIFPTVLEISRITVTCRIESVWEVYRNGLVIADLRTGAAQPSANFLWHPSREFEIGDVVEIILTKRPSSPDVNVGLYVQGLLKTVT